MITLEPVPQDGLHLVVGLCVRPDQVRFSGQVEAAFAHPDPDIDFHRILRAGQVAGFFKIDRAYPKTIPIAPAGALGLRAFLIDHRQQGQGIAVQAVARLPEYLRRHYPTARQIYLTVNFANPAAINCYLKGGFVDTGEVWPHGKAGPQHLMRMDL